MNRTSHILGWPPIVPLKVIAPAEKEVADREGRKTDNKERDKKDINIETT